MNYTQIIKFAVAGVIGACIEISLFVLMVDYMGVFYLTANLIAISVAVSINYLISQKWVFDPGRYSRKVEFAAFLGVSLFALMLNQLLMWILVETLELDTTISKVLAIGFVAVFNFIAKKFFVFKG
jgi:putative flippase GtrA